MDNDFMAFVTTIVFFGIVIALYSVFAYDPGPECREYSCENRCAPDSQYCYLHKPYGRTTGAYKYNSSDSRSSSKSSSSSSVSKKSSSSGSSSTSNKSTSYSGSSSSSKKNTSSKKSSTDKYDEGYDSDVDW